MSFVSATPEIMTSAATDLATIGSDLDAAHKAAAASSVVVMPAAADEVSAAISAVFGNYAQGFQSLAGRAAAFHDQFVRTLSAGAASYAGAEVASDSILRTVLHEIIFLQPIIHGVQTITQSVELSFEGVGESFYSVGQGLQFLGLSAGPPGQGLVLLGQGLQGFGQSLLDIAQEIGTWPISGQS